MRDETTKRYDPSKFQRIPLYKIEQEIARREDEKSRTFWRNCLLWYIVGVIAFVLALEVMIRYYSKS